jgi:hypothetical protein
MAQDVELYSLDLRYEGYRMKSPGERSPVPVQPMHSRARRGAPRARVDLRLTSLKF